MMRLAPDAPQAPSASGQVPIESAGTWPEAEDEIARTGSLDALRVRLLGNAFRRAFFPTLLASSVIGWLVSAGGTTLAVAIWLGATWTTMAVRSGYAVRIVRRPPDHTAGALRALTILSGIVGMAHGLVAFLFLPQLAPRDQAVVTMVVMCWTAGSLLVGSMAPRVFIAFGVCAALPFAIFWASRGGDGWLIALLIVLLFVMLVLFSRDAARVLVRSWYLRHQNDQLLRQLEFATQRRATFIEYLNHDLRNALGVVGMGTASLSLRADLEAHKAVLDRCNQGLDWARGLIDALDELAKLDTGAIPVRPEPTALADIAQSLLWTFQSTAADKGLSLQINAAAVTARIDERLLKRVLQNLVENAIKYTARGSVTVTGTLEGSAMRWTVDDTGPGIPEAERERVFEEFYQLGNPERARAKGRGLGLSVVKRFVDLMQGSVRIETADSGGARFVVVVPCEVVALAAPAATHGLPVVRARDDAAVWIIDDQAEARESLEDVIRTIGYRTRAFEEPAALLAALTIAAPDAMLCDYRLRDAENGLDLARHVRERAPRVAVALITGESALEQIDRIRASGFAVLRKPAELRELAAWLAQATHQP